MAFNTPSVGGPPGSSNRGRIPPEKVFERELCFMGGKGPEQVGQVNRRSAGIPPPRYIFELGSSFCGASAIDRF